MREPLVCLKTEFFFTFSHLCGQVVLSNEGNCKICAAWHISCCPYQMSQKKSSLASADTANFLRLHLWLQELVLRGGCWRFWTELIWGSSNTEDSEGSRLPWGTNQHWSQVYVIYARALEDETCSCCYLHQGRVTAGREKRQIPPLVSCGMKGWRKSGSAASFYASVTSVLSLFCVKYALALNLVHSCPLLGQEFKFSFAAENNSPVLDIEIMNMPACAKGT